MISSFKINLMTFLDESRNLPEKKKKKKLSNIMSNKCISVVVSDYFMMELPYPEEYTFNFTILHFVN
jgi:hypothetical protein